SPFLSLLRSCLCRETRKRKTTHLAWESVETGETERRTQARSRRKTEAPFLENGCESDLSNFTSLTRCIIFSLFFSRWWSTHQVFNQLRALLEAEILPKRMISNKVLCVA